MLDEARIAEIVERVVERLGTRQYAPPAAGAAAVQTKSGRGQVPRGTLGVYRDVESAVQAARRGFEANERAPLELRRQMIAAMRDVTYAHIPELARYAVEETGLGRYDDKLAKNKLVADKTPGPEILRPVAVTGDHGLMITERAPYGVIVSVTPCTNPTETVLNNAIGMISGGNAVVFNVHPAARAVCNWYVHLLNQAIQSVGGPADVLVSIEEPTIQSAQALMAHAQVRLVVVTGGPAVVAAAMKSGKKVIGAGPGNPPAVVDETANLGRAADAIIRGASIDNNILCTAEKEIIAVDSIADALLRELTSRTALLLTDRQVRDLEKVVLDGDHTNKEWVGKDASLIAEQVGIRGKGSDLRLLVCDVDEQHPFVQHELLMPVVGLVRARDTADAIATAKRVEHGFHHTAVIHSTNIEHMAAMARVCNASIFVKNDCNLAGLGLGGEGYTSFTIASPTGEGMTNATHFTRERRCTLKDAFRFV
ncbi:MAG TPA: aldehyde dehydrogenase family protein [Kofleriaceae bacterium]|nr:aldehyde dehydrogenase family protein [Kofleriaceae bacterium]